MRWLDAQVRAALDPVPASFAGPAGHRLAAVLAPLFVAAQQDHLLLVRRRAGLAHHAGQLAFPGGAREGDEDPLACALRECEEETGIAARDVVVLGALTPRASSAGFFVTPLVARIPPPPADACDSTEIECLLPVALAELADPGRWELRDVPGRGPTPHFPIGEHALWGLTARFVRELLERVLGAR